MQIRCCSLFSGFVLLRLRSFNIWQGHFRHSFGWKDGNQNCDFIFPLIVGFLSSVLFGYLWGSCCPGEILFILRIWDFGAHTFVYTQANKLAHSDTLTQEETLSSLFSVSTNLPTLAVLPRNSQRIHTDILPVLSPSCSIKPAIAWIQVVCFSLSAFLSLQCVWYEFRLCSGMTANTVPSSWMSPRCWCNRVARILILRLVLCSVASPDRDRGS